LLFASHFLLRSLGPNERATPRGRIGVKKFLAVGIDL
jgi:hypothetical protein